MKHDLSHGAAWMNGNVLPISQATIPVNDWGLVHSYIKYDLHIYVYKADIVYAPEAPRWVRGMEDHFFFPSTTYVRVYIYTCMCMGRIMSPEQLLVEDCGPRGYIYICM